MQQKKTQRVVYWQDKPATLAGGHPTIVLDFLNKFKHEHHY